MAKKKTYYLVEIFALGRTGGGVWEDDVVVSNDSPQLAYDEALDFVRSKGFAFEVKISLCNKNGEPLQ